MKIRNLTRPLSASLYILSVWEQPTGRSYSKCACVFSCS